MDQASRPAGEHRCGLAVAVLAVHVHPRPGRGRAMVPRLPARCHRGSGRQRKRPPMRLAGGLAEGEEPRNRRGHRRRGDRAGRAARGDRRRPLRTRPRAGPRPDGRRPQYTADQPPGSRTGRGPDTDPGRAASPADEVGAGHWGGGPVAIAHVEGPSSSRLPPTPLSRPAATATRCAMSGSVAISLLAMCPDPAEPAATPKCEP